MTIGDILKYFCEDTKIRIWENNKIVLESDYTESMTNDILNKNIEINGISVYDDCINIAI